MLLPTKVEVCTTLDAVMLVAPKAKVPPTAPVNVTVPVPAVFVSARDDVALFSVLLKLILLSVVAKVTPAPKVTAPVYPCVPVVVMLALIAVVPETLKVVKLVTAPPNDALPLMAKLLPAPSSVELNVTVEPVNVRVALDPLKVTAPV